jgi:hypothetical protein
LVGWMMPPPKKGQGLLEENRGERGSDEGWKEGNGKRLANGRLINYAKTIFGTSIQHSSTSTSDCMIEIYFVGKVIR